MKCMVTTHSSKKAGTLPISAKLEQPKNSNIKKVIAIMSGKGGVGKSSVSALVAAQLARMNFAIGLMDADVTGPSIPKLFGIKGNPATIKSQLIPKSSKSSIKVVSLNLLLEREDDPVIWRGPLIAGAIKQFWTDVMWGELDYMVIDLPPGTGDVPLTVFQSLPVDGVVIVSTPQKLSEMVVTKAVNMVRLMDVPIVGLVENMGWVQCSQCNNKIEPFGPSRADLIAKSMGISLLGSLPLDPKISDLGDKGLIEEYQLDTIQSIANKIIENI